MRRSAVFAEQIKATIMQFATIKEVHIFINGTPMEKLLGGGRRLNDGIDTDRP